MCFHLCRWEERFSATSIVVVVLQMGGILQWRKWDPKESVELVVAGSLSACQMVLADRWMKRRKCMWNEKPLAIDARSFHDDEVFCYSVDVTIKKVLWFAQILWGGSMVITSSSFPPLLIVYLSEYHFWRCFFCLGLWFSYSIHQPFSLTAFTNNDHGTILQMDLHDM